MTDKNTLKQWFSRGMKPLETQFAEWIDSFWHKSEKIPAEKIDGLQDALNDKADVAAVAAAIEEMERQISQLPAFASDSWVDVLFPEFPLLDTNETDPDIWVAGDTIRLLEAGYYPGLDIEVTHEEIAGNHVFAQFLMSKKFEKKLIRKSNINN